MATRTDFHLSAAATGYPGFQTLILCLSSTQSKLQCSLKRKQNFFFHIEIKQMQNACPRVTLETDDS